MSQTTPSQRQQSVPGRHDDKFASMKECLSCRREEASSGLQPARNGCITTSGAAAVLSME
ncbi:hypothetical protein E2562_036819 [Oryza meyeriana var. granulata]|uniref:Uncharacterized protein n=1 Tax=Oryza meyeriana var. granulata TaxID=110450 RepID=A0A6G1E6K3_9ORYZ|nr:hypothetical protein E2562_036819 [Oryza meyeriana var. granulata]